MSEHTAAAPAAGKHGSTELANAVAVSTKSTTGAASPDGTTAAGKRAGERSVNDESTLFEFSDWFARSMADVVGGAARDVASCVDDDKNENLLGCGGDAAIDTLDQCRHKSNKTLCRTTCEVTIKRIVPHRRKVDDNA